MTRLLSLVPTCKYVGRDIVQQPQSVLLVVVRESGRAFDRPQQVEVVCAEFPGFLNEVVEVHGVARPLDAAARVDRRGHLLNAEDYNVAQSGNGSGPRRLELKGALRQRWHRPFPLKRVSARLERKTTMRSLALRIIIL